MNSHALLLGYGLDQPSFRYRMNTLIAPLQGAGWSVRAEQFPGGHYGLRTWERRALLRWADVTILHQIKLSSMEAYLFAAYSRCNIFDVDDAIYVRKPRHLGEPAQDSAWRRRKFASTCRMSDAVAAGNAVLAGVAAAGARRVCILPTSLDPFPGIAAPGPGRQTVVVVWIGTPENLLYLELVRPALAKLTQHYPQLRLRVICSRFPDWPEVNIEAVPWSAATEIEALKSADIGIMPLADDEWTRGKCAFKLLQYMAAGLPCVASPIGANVEAVVDQRNGYHASSSAQWEEGLGRLIAAAPLRAQFGAAGVALLREKFSVRTYTQRYLELLASLQ